jgi:hypothetical protein
MYFLDSITMIFAGLMVRNEVAVSAFSILLSAPGERSASAT